VTQIMKLSFNIHIITHNMIHDVTVTPISHKHLLLLYLILLLLLFFEIK